MNLDVLPKLTTDQLARVAKTLTHPRLGKYLRAANNDDQQALRLYVLNSKVGAALMTDLHYAEVALRNRFADELAVKFGPGWYKAPAFLNLVDVGAQKILRKAERAAGKHWSGPLPLPDGKVIAELTFGFWVSLTDPGLEHKLWVPCLHKAFAPRKPPKRAVFNQLLEKLRQLRNRIAHHEPVFHLDLVDAHRKIVAVEQLLCPTTVQVMLATSSVKRQVMALTRFRRQRGL